MVLGWSVMNFGSKYHSYAILFLLIMICSFLLGCLSCKPLFVEGKLKKNCQSYRSFQRPVIWSVTSSCAICHLLSLFFLAIKAFLIEMITKWWLSNTKAWNIALDACSTMTWMSLTITSNVILKLITIISIHEAQ